MKWRWKWRKINDQCVASKLSWYRGCHGFESCWSPDFRFRLLLSSCLNWKIYCDDHSSLSLRGITALLLSISKGNKNLRHKRLSLLCSAWNKKKTGIQRMIFENLKRWKICTENFYLRLLKLIKNLSKTFATVFLSFLFSFSFDWEDISNTQDSVYHISRNLEVHQKYSAVPLIFSFLLLGVLKCGQTFNI